MQTSFDQSIFENRPQQIDYDRIDGLHYLGNYVRRLPVSLARMMENAHDWEHLPHVHKTSFASIDCVDAGPWGWRAKADLPEASGGGTQHFDLLVDNDRHYWATTLLAGPGTGVEIHTQATEIAADEIEVDVRFYVPEALPDPAVGDFVLSQLQTQYKTLYDEDLGLMSGRAAALDDRRKWRANPSAEWPIHVGPVASLDKMQVHLFDVPGGRVCVRHYGGQWMTHSATCPHLLGPLNESAISDDGKLTCPWHGYQFNAATGESADGKCRALDQLARLEERDDAYWLVAV